MKNISIIGCLSFFLISSCSPTYNINENIVVELENNGVGGYVWRSVENKGVILIDSSETKVLKPNKLTQYNKVYKFEGVKKGRYNLIFHKIRSFEIEKELTKEQIYIKKIRIK